MRRRLAVLLIPFLLVSACKDDLTEPQDEGAMQPAFTAASGQRFEVRDLRPLDVAPHEGEAALSLPALGQAVEAADGMVLIALKSRSAPRWREAGRRSGTDADAIVSALAAVEAAGAEVRDYFPSFGIALAHVATRDLPRLVASPFVDFVSPNMPATSFGASSETSTTASMAQTVPWGIDYINAPDVWSLEDGGTKKMMIIDAGYDRFHQDLPAVSVSTQCSGMFGATDACSDGTSGHGTAVAGVVAARNNSIGVVGVAPGIANSALYIHKAVNPFDYLHRVWDADVIAGLQKADDANVLVVTMQFGWPAVGFGGTDTHDATRLAVQSAWQDGIVIVASAGNALVGWPTTLFYPAIWANVLSVGGSLQSGAFANTSPCTQNGAAVRSVGGDIAAPFLVHTTLPGSTYTTTEMCGTSFSAPHVAGAIYLLRSYYFLTPAQAVDIVLETASGPGGGGLGAGVVDVAAAFGPLARPLLIGFPGTHHPIQYQPFWIRLLGAGFNPANAQAVVYGGPGTSCPSECVFSSWTTATTKELYLASLQLSLPGRYTGRVRNGSTGTLSTGTFTFEVHPL